MTSRTRSKPGNARTQMWGGRMKKGLDPRALMFSTSIREDFCLLTHDIEASEAWAEGLRRAKIINVSELRRIKAGLASIRKEPSPDIATLDKYEDVHSYVEARLRQKAGPVADKLHAGRSRNDQVLTDVALFLRSSFQRIDESLIALISALLRVAKREIESVVPGYTHLQPAQAVTVGAQYAAYASMLLTDRCRLRKFQDMHNHCPLGSSAIAGTSLPIDREFLARRLKFAGPTRSAMETIAGRDAITDRVYALTMILTHLSRFSEDMILWATPAFGFLKLPDEFSTGSSLMPQKRNPDMSELTRGRAARGIAALAGILALQKSLPLTYNRDLQEDKKYLFELTCMAGSIVALHAPMVDAFQFDRKRMRDACRVGFLEATDLAEYLVTQGVAFRDAHDIVGRLVSDAEIVGRALSAYSLHELRRFSGAFGPGALPLLDAAGSPGRKRTSGSVSPRLTAGLIRALERELKR